MRRALPILPVLARPSRWPGGTTLSIPTAITVILSASACSPTEEEIRTRAAEVEQAASRCSEGDEASCATLASTAQHDPIAFVRAFAVRQPALDDPALLAELAEADPEDDVRSAAVQRVTDQKLLARLAVSDDHEWVRVHAIERVEDLALVSRRAVADASSQVRYTAVLRIADQALLSTIARNDADDDVRFTAAKRLTDRILAVRVMKEVALGGSGSQLSALAQGERLDQAVLLLVATQDESYVVREVTVGQLEDPAILAEIARTDPKATVRETATHQREAIRFALGCEAGHSEDCDSLASMAWDSEMRRRRAGIRCLANEAALAEVALRGDVREREAAVENPHLVDQSLLAEIATKEGEDPFVREAAVRKLDDRALLAQLASEGAEYPSVRDGASARLAAIGVAE